MKTYNNNLSKLALSALIFSGVCFSAQTMAKDFEYNDKILKQGVEVQYQRMSQYTTLITRQFDANRSLVHYILAELEARDLPTSLVLLPMLESTFNPNAVSPMEASGLWQLMPHTAQRFGLEVSSKHDERLNVNKSTKAALNYLAFLYNKFDNDIALTIAAYNSGEGRVQSQLLKQPSTLFSNLDLPRETVEYVEKFHALARLVDVNKFKSSTLERSPIIRATVGALVPLSSKETGLLEHLFAKRPIINRESVKPLIAIKQNS